MTLAWPGSAVPLGASCTAEGTNFAVFSAPATAVNLCLFDEAGAEHRVALLDSAAPMSRSVVVDRAHTWNEPVRPNHTVADSIVYECHVKGMTALHPDVPPAQRGTYAGLAHPARRRVAFCFRGLDQGSYYLLAADGSAVNEPGTGNTWSVWDPAALRLILDSLRYRATDMHVDGFRFDLATVLAATDPGHSVGCSSIWSRRIPSWRPASSSPSRGTPDRTTRCGCSVTSLPGGASGTTSSATGSTTCGAACRA